MCVSLFVCVCVCVCMRVSLFGSIQEEVVKDAESVRSQQQQHLQQHSCTLDECFQLYTKEEQVTLHTSTVTTVTSSLVRPFRSLKASDQLTLHTGTVTTVTSSLVRLDPSRHQTR